MNQWIEWINWASSFLFPHGVASWVLFHSFLTYPLQHLEHSRKKRTVAGVSCFKMAINGTCHGTCHWGLRALWFDGDKNEHQGIRSTKKKTMKKQMSRLFVVVWRWSCNMYTKLQVFLGSDDSEFLGINCINVMYQHLQIWQKDVAKGDMRSVLRNSWLRGDIKVKALPTKINMIYMD